MKAVIALWVWIVIVTTLSLMPDDGVEIDLFPHQDKLVHFIFYFVLTILIRTNLKSNQNIFHIAAIVIAILYGVVMELIQEGFISGRHFDYFDIIANIIGSLGGSCVYYFLIRKQDHHG